MGSPPEAPPIDPPVRRRRRRSSSRRILLISALVCVPLALAVPAVRYFGWWPKHDRDIHEKSTRNFDVVLSEASVRGDGAARRIVGLLRNNSKHRYDDVDVTFVVRDRTASLIGTASATIKTMEPGTTAPFETNPLPADGFRVALREIGGTRR